MFINLIDNVIVVGFGAIMGLQTCDGSRVAVNEHHRPINCSVASGTERKTQQRSEVCCCVAQLDCV